MFCSSFLVPILGKSRWFFFFFWLHIFGFCPTSHHHLGYWSKECQFQLSIVISACWYFMSEFTLHSIASTRVQKTIFITAIEYKFGRNSFNAQLPHHVSCQNRTLLPSPITNVIHKFNANRPYNPPKVTPWMLDNLHCPFTPSFPILHTNHSSPKMISFLQNATTISPNKDWLMVSDFLTPNPTLDWRAHCIPLH